MACSLSIPTEQIIHSLKLSCKIPTLVDSVLTHRIIVEAAAEHQIEVGLEELQAAADQIRLANALHRSEETLSWLEHHWMTLDDFEEMVRLGLLSNKLAHRLFDDQADLLFVEQYSTYLQAYLYQIVLDDADLAWELFYALQSEEIAFFEVAQQYAQDLELKRKGGYCGLVQRSDLSPEICGAVFSASPPQILKPITTAQGIHLIRVEEILEPQLNEDLRQKLVTMHFSQWISQKVHALRA